MLNWSTEVNKEVLCCRAGDFSNYLEGQQTILEVLNIGLSISFRGVEVSRGIYTPLTVEDVCPNSTGECVIVATTLKCVVASLTEQQIIPSDASQCIVAAKPAG